MSLQIHRVAPVAREMRFTLVELLVVIAIIGMLVALLAARGASGAGVGAARPLHEQPQADRPGLRSNITTPTASFPRGGSQRPRSPFPRGRSSRVDTVSSRSSCRTSKRRRLPAFTAGTSVPKVRRTSRWRPRS